jgi:hypothetical protein
MRQNIIVLLLFLVIYLSGNNNALSMDIEGLPDNDNSYVFVINKDYSETEGDLNINVSKKLDVRPLSFPACSEVPLQLDECKESVCVDNSPFGKVYHKIKGKDSQGNCEYVQTTPGFGGIECEFQINNISMIASLIEKFSTRFAEQKISLNHEENEKLKALLQKNCKIIQDRALHEPIQISKLNKSSSANTTKGTSYDAIQSENYSFTGPQLNTNKPSESDASPSKQDVKLAQENKPVALASVNKSIMFTQEVVDTLEQTLEGKIPSDNSLTSAALSSEKGLGFYLNSIIFIEPEKWAIWVNNKRIIKGEKVPDFDIADVNNNSVILTYSIKNIDKVLPDWRRKLISVTPQSFKSLDEYIKLALDKDNHATISVQLKPNQTFELSSMHVYEGK